MAELHRMLINNDPDLLLGLADQRGNDGLAGFQVAGGQVPACDGANLARAPQRQSVSPRTRSGLI